MIEETYLKEYHDLMTGEDTLLVSFEGDRDDVYVLREYAKKLNNEKEEAVEPQLDLSELKDLLDEIEQKSIRGEETDMVSHPIHYNREGALETIWEMVALYGIEDVKAFCRLNSHKYRGRAMNKGGEEDMRKSDFYIKFCAYLETTSEDVVYKHLKEQCDNFRDIKKNGSN